MISFGACKGEKAAASPEVIKLCEDNYAHGELAGDKWTPAKGDKTKFIAFCTEQKPEVIKCSSMTVEPDDKECEKVVGIHADDHEGFATRIKFTQMRLGE